VTVPNTVEASIHVSGKTEKPVTFTSPLSNSARSE
jgi:hypothetical protein